MGASLTTTGGHKITTSEFIDAERYYCSDQAFRDKLITDKRASEGLPIFYAPTQKPMYLEILVVGDPENCVWKEYGSSDKYKGDFTSEANLNSAIPLGEPGWWAIIDTASQDAYKMLWDNTDNIWVRGGSNVTGITAQQAADIQANNNARVTNEERNLWNSSIPKILSPPSAGTFQIDLSTTGGTDYSSNITSLEELAILPGAIVGGFARIKGNWANEPNFTGATQIASSIFQSSTQLYLYIEKWADGVIYWFNTN